jgi:hypothetical protein
MWISVVLPVCETYDFSCNFKALAESVKPEIADSAVVPGVLDIYVLINYNYE